MNIRKIQEYLFFAFLFFLPFQTVFLLREVFVDGEKWQYGTIGVYATDILLVVIFGTLLLQMFYKSHKERTEKNREHTLPHLLSFITHPVSLIIYHSSPLIFFLLWSGLSILWAGDQVLALSFFVKLLFAVGLFFLIQSWKSFDVKKIVFVLLCAGVLQSGIGIGQFLYQKSIDSSILGMNAYQASEAGSSVLKIDSGPASPSLGGRFLRAYGTFHHPNMLGGFLGVILVLGIAYYVFCFSYEERWKKGSHFSFFLSLITYPASLILILLGLLLTFSRSAWLGVGVGIFVLGIVVFFQKEWDIRIRFFKILIALGLAVTVFGSLLSEQILPRFDTVTIEREGSVTERLQSLRDAERVIGEGNMVLGTGIGNFTAKMIQMQPERPVWNIQPAHNVFVLVFAELGIVGFVLFVGFLFFVVVPSVRRLWRCIKKIQDVGYKMQDSESLITHQLSFVFPLLVFIPSLFLDHFLWSSHFGLFFFFLLLGLVSRR